MEEFLIFQKKSYIKLKFCEGILNILITKQLHIWEAPQELQQEFYSNFLKKGLNITVSACAWIVSIWTYITEKA